MHCIIRVFYKQKSNIVTPHYLCVVFRVPFPQALRVQKLHAELFAVCDGAHSKRGPLQTSSPVTSLPSKLCSSFHLLRLRLSLSIPVSIIPTSFPLRLLSASYPSLCLLCCLRPPDAAPPVMRVHLYPSGSLLQP